MDWTQIATNFGVSVACLFGLSWAVWSSLKWIGMHVLKPLADRHLSFIDQVAQNLVAQTTAMQKLADETNAEGKERREELEKLDHIASKLAEITSGISEVRALIIRTDSVQIVPRTVEERGPPHLT